MAENCRPCPLSRVGCGASESAGDQESLTCSPAAAGVAFLLPLGSAVLGAGLAESLLGPQALEQLFGALVGLTAGVVASALTLRLLARKGAAS